MKDSTKDKIIAVLLGIIIVEIIAILGITIFKKVEDEKTTEINIVVYNQENKEIYNEEIKTEEKYLIDVLEETKELKVITESGDYGAYITSILDLEQKDNYYWNYYIDGEYGNTGVSNCELEEDTTYTFKLEKFE